MQYCHTSDRHLQNNCPIRALNKTVVQTNKKFRYRPGLVLSLNAMDKY